MADVSNHYIGKESASGGNGPSGLFFFCVLLAILASIFFSITSCKHVELVTEVIHDTITTTKTDTFLRVSKEKEIITRVDSVSHTEYIKGDSVFIRDFKIIFRDREVASNDSTYKSTIDSLKHVIDSTKELTKEPEKPKKKPIKEFAYNLFITIFAACVFGLLIVLLKKILFK